MPFTANAEWCIFKRVRRVYFKTIDGHLVEDFNIKWLRSKLGFVQQEPLLFSGTVRENILYGCDEDVDMERVIDAAKDANIHGASTAVLSVQSACTLSGTPYKPVAKK